MVGLWVFEIPDELLPTIYRAMIHLLSDSDLVIALSAVQSLQNCKL
jgi:hypothetical protein